MNKKKYLNCDCLFKKSICSSVSAGIFGAKVSKPLTPNSEPDEGEVVFILMFAVLPVAVLQN